MAEQPIAANEYDAGSPITESLMTRIVENQQDLYVQVAAASEPTNLLTGSGTYVVPADVTKIKVTLVSGGGGGGVGVADNVRAGGGGAAGDIHESILTVTPAASLSYACGAGGASATNGALTTFSTLTTLVASKGNNGNVSVSNSGFWGDGTAADGLGGYSLGGSASGGNGGNSLNGVDGKDSKKAEGCAFSGDIGAGAAKVALAYGGGGGGAPFGYHRALDIFGAYTDYNGGAGGAGAPGGNGVAGSAGGTASGGGGGGCGTSSGGAGGAGGNGFILIWEIA
jgi:hypothetical protein